MRRAVLFTMVIIAATLYSGCKGKDAEDRKENKGNVPVVRVHEANRESIAEVARLTGEVVATRLARLASPAEGPIIACKVREGDRVKEGELLVSIGKTKAAEASLTAAEVELEKQQEEYKRVEQLVRAGALPGDQLDEAAARLARAKAERAKAMEESEDYRISSPWDGVASKVMVTEGDYVLHQSPLIELYDPDSLVVRFAVPEAWTSLVHAGTECEISFDAYPGRLFAARVDRVFGELDRDTRMLNVELAIADSVNLIPGMFARIRLTLARIDNAVVIPVSAVLSGSGGHSTVFVIKDNKASLRKVRTGIEEGNRVQILEGVEAGEVVVVAGNENLKDGMLVQIRGDRKTIATPPEKRGKASE